MLMQLQEDESSTKSEKQKIVCQTDKCNHNSDAKVDPQCKGSAWEVSGNSDKVVSIADQVKEVAQNAMAESGMVYVESAGMYYDYKTGYYYNSELGLYYHSSTGCYYAYSDDNKNFTFHSYADSSKFLIENEAHVAHEKKKAKKHRKDNEDGAKNEARSKRKKYSSSVNKEGNKEQGIEEMTKTVDQIDNDVKIKSSDRNSDEFVLKPRLSKKNKNEPKSNNIEDVEDGECSQTDSEFSASTSTATIADDDSVAKNHPPCMRIIVRETNLSKLKVGTLFLVTKDGGTIGREGDTHTVLLKDHNVSRNHLDIRYDNVKRAYVAMDLGSKNGTVLNGTRMSESQEISFPLEVPHGSILQVGETKLLCHIHLGNDTCGHCEPGLVMEADDEEKRVAYTRTCSVQKQHQLELARLKNKYAPEPLAIEDASYNDRAKARREKFGSTHHAEKTQQSDLETCKSGIQIEIEFRIGTGNRIRTCVIFEIGIEIETERSGPTYNRVAFEAHPFATTSFDLEKESDAAAGILKPQNAEVRPTELTYGYNVRLSNDSLNKTAIPANEENTDIPTLPKRKYFQLQATDIESPHLDPVATANNTTLPKQTRSGRDTKPPDHLRGNPLATYSLCAKLGKQF
ncbi:Angiogenic factor with G patch and FHA domains 1 [Eumeta japonica]|uniref:Angiogenic factor with G patch and FHA domains 1 n=1 Tax=Eumeta variegata TaxID=151549 RepID=A0A4C1XKZ9_EUMVA|nr:Angiogenic factor with G patch and FHA domains 1 [Eumeta japonica]